MWQNKSRRHPCECPLQKEAGLQTKKSADPQKKKYEDMVSEMEELREYVKQKQRLNELAREYGLE